MPTIKDVARLSGVSVTTVSIILNGKAAERRITQATCDKVSAAMQALGYQPDLSARRLRSTDVRKPIIAFFWPLDFRKNIMLSFLTSIQSALQQLNFDCELVVQTYIDGKLEESAAPIIKNSYNGVIIGAATPNDLEYLETLSPQMPIVLINRSSNKFSTVSTDNSQLGFEAATLIRQKGYDSIAVFKGINNYMASNKRMQSFFFACNQLGINIEAENNIGAENSVAGGARAGQAFCSLEKRPHMIFAESDSMAIGALYSLHKNGVVVPDDVEILALGQLEPEATQYLIPSLSVIAMPNAEIAGEAVSIIYTALKSGDFSPLHLSMPATTILRESFSVKKDK